MAKQLDYKSMIPTTGLNEWEYIVISRFDEKCSRLAMVTFNREKSL